mgnify:CR=1 FL=1
MSKRREKSSGSPSSIVVTVTGGEKKLAEDLVDKSLTMADSDVEEDLPEELPEMIVDAFSKMPSEQQEQVIMKLWNSRA